MSKIVARYDYTNAKGEPRLQKVRFEPKRFMWRSWDPRPGRETWVKGINDWQYGWSLRALYRLPELIAALKANEPVYLAEGEKDADALVSCGLVATSHGGGADQFEAGQAKWFAGYGSTSRIYIVCDNDAAGAYSGHLRYTMLRQAGVDARRIRVIAPTWDLRRLKDAHDLVAACGTRPLAWRRVNLARLRAATFRYRTARISRYTYPAPSRPGEAS
jgi:hypothetical protein